VEEYIKVRPHGNGIHNDYYKTVEVIDVGKCISDAFVCPYTAEMILEEYEDETYSELIDGNNSLGYYINVVEAFEKTWVFVNTYGDPISNVFIDKDGEVRASAHECTPDLDGECYYAGDEVSIIGYTEAFDSNSSWLWNSVERNVKQVCLGVSVETFKKLTQLRKDYLQEQASKV
jgi:hypothetical protein